MCASQRVFLCLEALAVALLRHFEARGCRQGAIWSVDNARQKETPAEGRGSKTSLGSVTLFPPREAFSSHIHYLYPTGTVTVVGGRLVACPQSVS